MTINNLVKNLLFLVVNHLPRAFAKASLAGDFDGHRPAVSRQAAYLFGFSRPVRSLPPRRTDATCGFGFSRPVAILHHRLSDELCGFPMRLGLNGTAAKTFVDVLLAVGSVV